MMRRYDSRPECLTRRLTDTTWVVLYVLAWLALLAVAVVGQ